MRRHELTEVLRQPYTAAAGCGIEKVDKPGYENIWFVVPPSPPERLTEVLSLPLLRDANLALQSRPSPRSASEIQKTMAFLLKRREAVSSSRMEGTWSTVDAVLTPAKDPEAHSATASVRGYASALIRGIEAIEENGVAALTTVLVRELHSKIMEKDPGMHAVAGKIREPGMPGDIIQIGAFGRREDSIYNPAPPARVARSLDKVLAWLSDVSILATGDAGLGLSLPIRMAVGHSHFEAVHPFSDGNGRVGRMLWALQMTAAGHLPLYLSGFVESEKDEYGAALQEAQKQLSYRRLVEFVCNAVVACAAEEHVTAQTLGGLPDEWQERGKFRRGSAAARTLRLLLSTPIMTVKLLSTELDVPVETASQGLKRLERGGVVRDRTRQGRGRIYAAEEVINVLSRPYGSDIGIALASAREVLT